MKQTIEIKKVLSPTKVIATIVPKKHRHKWIREQCDCPFCQSEHAYCECGELKIL